MILTYPTSVSVTEVNIVKDKPSEKMGLSLKNTPRESGIGITGLSREESSLRGTAIRATGGQVLVAINGNPDIPDAKTASSMISKSTRLSLLVCEQHHDFANASKQACIQVVAAPFWRHNPGINFASTRGRTLVTVSKIFKRGPFAEHKYISVGDIVLAVNGIPVSKPEDADKALRLPQADSSVTVLHTIDMNYFRAAAMNAVDTSKITGTGATLSFKPDPHDATKQHHVMHVKRVGHTDKHVRIRYDPETQHMYDPEPFTKLCPEGDYIRTDFSNPKVFYRNWYCLGALKFINMFNKIVDENLDPLEDSACEYSWRNSPSNAIATTAPISPSSSSSVPEVEVYVPTNHDLSLRSLTRTKSHDDDEHEDYIAC
ncbi:expressed unknown protein [Seminavis robusta]|uniref:PDZ domain-containing protein n=1 Tax=Seminavis robusta TaxID=568900 RepID=A0A9N8HFB2_9STRA|nr:expressed unknown protein [Seminavis robusta]|eukprot:Sro427_g140630.1 n/a (373) ;mRNA; f:21921-23126